MNLLEFEKYIKEKNKKHIIFDFDGTICKLLINWQSWYQEMEALSEYYKTEVTVAEVGFQKIQNAYIEKGGEEARNKILEINYRNEKQHYTGYELLPVALPLLELVKKCATVYVWTSNDHRTIDPILVELGMDNFFTKVVARNDVTFIKPDPEGFSLIYDEKNPKTEYLIIGDSDADEGAAQNAGIDFLNIAEFKLN